MDEKWNTRTIQLIGNDSYNALQQSHVLVAGLGGVGAYAVEMLARAGIGELTIVDFDTISESNINRQLIALNSTLGLNKIDILQNRILDINPKIELHTINEFIREEKISEILSQKFDFVVDAIDTLSPKTNLLIQSVKNNIPVVSSMGSGAKLNPEKIEIADISKTHNCKLARMLRKRLHRMGIKKGITAVYSKELPDMSSTIPVYNEDNKISTVGTISYMPAIFGCYCASVVLKNLMGKNYLE
jgi:tRNA A37 threonylcarbamoyladenosine dehydratase